MEKIELRKKKKQKLFIMFNDDIIKMVRNFVIMKCKGLKS